MSYSHYDKTANGMKMDVYRICKMYDVTDPAIFQSIKKLLRCGKAHKDARQDVIEARDGLNRWLEMEDEDSPIRTCHDDDYLPPVNEPVPDGMVKTCAPVPEHFKEIVRNLK